MEGNNGAALDLPSRRGKWVAAPHRATTRGGVSRFPNQLGTVDQLTELGVKFNAQRGVECFALDYGPI
jgi:hypothetical protein